MPSKRRIITRPFTNIADTLRRDFLWKRLFAEEYDVVGNNWLSRSRKNPVHMFANCVRLLVALVLPPLYLLCYGDIGAVVLNTLYPSWTVEKAYAPKAFLHNAKRRKGGAHYAPGKFSPRWLIKVTYGDEQNPHCRQVGWVNWVDEKKAILESGYTALSYSYENAKELFHETFPSIPFDIIPLQPYSPTDPDSSLEDPLMTAWRQYPEDPALRKRWEAIAVRQRVARLFLDCYLDAKVAPGGTDYVDSTRRPGTIEYIWLDEFCLYSPSQPNLDVRGEELGCMADIFSSASAVCVYCPKHDCDHADNECDWGKRLWTLSEILHTSTVITLTRRRNHPFATYTLTTHRGRDFRSQMQNAAEKVGEWHLSAIMRHANNGGSTTWQHSIHALVVEAIRRNGESGHTNKFLAKALNGLLPRRAQPGDLLGKDGWADLAWLLELNQGYYNAASLAAACGLGETKVQGHGWLGPPIRPKAGNERLQPLVTAFPIEDGLFIMSPKIIGLRQDLERDSGGIYRNKKLVVLAWIANFLPIVTILWVLVTVFALPANAQVPWALFWIWFGFALTAGIRLVGSTLYVKKGGVFLLTKELLNGLDAETYLGGKDRQLAKLEEWGDQQLAPRWEEKTTIETEEAILVDLMSRVQSTFRLRKLEGKPPNALIPLAVHGCGVTCLVIHHHTDEKRFKPAVKLGVVNMPPYLLTIGETVGSLIVGAVPKEDCVPERLDTRRFAAHYIDYGAGDGTSFQTPGWNPTQAMSMTSVTRLV